MCIFSLNFKMFYFLKGSTVVLFSPVSSFLVYDFGWLVTLMVRGMKNGLFS